MKNCEWLSLFLLLLFFGCSEPEAQDSSFKRNGEELAAMHCGSCHQAPSPDDLNKATWKNYVLPRMGYMMGFYPHSQVRDSLLEQGFAGEMVNAKGLFPTEPAIDSLDWLAIQGYYLQESPEHLNSQEVALGSSSLFEVREPNVKLSPPSTTLLKFGMEQRILLGDAHSEGFYVFDSELNLIKRGTVPEGAVSMKEGSQGYLVTSMGSFSPTDEPSGMVLNVPKLEGQPGVIAIDSLRRPVDAAFGDLNGDGRTDAVIAEYGKWVGRLSLFLGQKGGVFDHHILLDQTGAMSVKLHDLNGNGFLDVIALFGQGNEGVWAFFNKGNGIFRSEPLLQFPPSYGSSSMQLVDFNQDGFVDILYTAGDNADYPPVTKPYHGIYGFENDGQGKFKQTFFQYLPGAYGARMADFDLDGDLDLAAISFYPDFNQDPIAGFSLFVNKSDWNFEGKTFEGVERGRWIVMDAADFDQDGDQDIILGSLAFEVIPPNPILDTWVSNGVPFVLLENTTK